MFKESFPPISGQREIIVAIRGVAFGSISSLIAETMKILGVRYMEGILVRAKKSRAI
jgi:hypothetical protein